jgi:DNA-binding MarR family transcriptional regulator
MAQNESANVHYDNTPELKLRQAYLAMHRAFDFHFLKSGVTADQFALLKSLSEADGAGQRKLAGMMSADANTVAAMLVLLEKRGLLRREAHPSDGRVKAVFLTAKGWQVLSDLEASSRELHEMVEECFRGRDGTSAYQVLDRVIAVMSVAKGVHVRRLRGSA